MLAGKSTLSASAPVFSPVKRLNPHAVAFVFSSQFDEAAPASQTSSSPSVSPVCQPESEPESEPEPVCIPEPVFEPVCAPEPVVHLPPAALSSQLSGSEQKTRSPSTPTKTPSQQADTPPRHSDRIFWTRQQLLDFRDRPECKDPPEAAVSDLECLRQFRSDDKAKAKPAAGWRVPKKVPPPPTKLSRTPSTKSKKDTPLDIEVVPLAMTENRYVVKDFEGEAKTLRLLNGILNKLTPESSDTLLQQVLAMGITTLTLLTQAVDAVFEKALSEPTFCPVYAEFCEKLAEKLPPVVDDSGAPKKFKSILLNQCQKEFETADRKDKDGNDLPEAEKRRRRLGTIVFIGELYVRGLLKSNIMFYCFQLLAQNPDEEDIEASCKLLRTVGKTLEQKDATQLTSVIDAIKKMATTEVSSRIRFMVQDIVDLRREKWVERIKLLKATKLSDVHKNEPPNKERAMKQAEDAPRRPPFSRQSSAERCNLGSPRKPTGGRVDDDGFSAATPKKKDKRPTKPDPRSRPLQTPTKKRQDSEELKKPQPGFGVLGDSEEDNHDHANREYAAVESESEKSKGEDTKEDTKEEKGKQDVERLLRDFLRTQDMKETRESIQELKPSSYSSIVDQGVLMLLDENQQNAASLLKMFKQLATDGVLTATHFETGLARPLECLEDLLLDCPLGLQRLAALMVPLLTNAVLPFSFFTSELAMNLKSSGVLGKWVGLTLAGIESERGSTEAAKLVQNGQLKIEGLFKSSELYHAFLNDHQDLKLAM